jgi:hypothetical protein
MGRKTSWNTTQEIELEVEKTNNGWTVGKREIPYFVNGKINPVVQYLGEGEFAVVKMDVACQGYSDSGNMSGSPDFWYPPEGEDERTVEAVSVEFYDEDGDFIQEYILDENGDRVFEDVFGDEIYDFDIDTDRW